MAEATGDPKYYSALAQYADKVLRIKKTPKGLVYVQKWGTNRHAANLAFITLQVRKYKEEKWLSATFCTTPKLGATLIG